MKLDNYKIKHKKAALIKQIGQAMLETSAGVAIPVALSDHMWIASSIWLMGVIGKFITVMFKEEIKNE